MAFAYAGLESLSVPLIIVIVVWTVFWKGVSLWNSAKNNQKFWFIALLILNTLGIVEIIYMFFFRKNRKNNDIFGRAKSKKTKSKKAKNKK